MAKYNKCANCGAPCRGTHCRRCYMERGEFGWRRTIPKWKNQVAQEMGVRARQQEKLDVLRQAQGHVASIKAKADLKRRGLDKAQSVTDALAKGPRIKVSLPTLKFMESK